MEVILFDNVKGLGRQGDLVKVSEGYFRNFLKPQNLAAEATPAALKQYEKMKKKAVELAAAKSADAKELAAKLSAANVTVKAKAGAGDKLFGAVTTQEIAKALEAAGFVVDKKQIETAEPIKSLGEHAVSVKIHSEVSGKFKLKVVRQD
jgi:large subunit ribosomal protein L9